MDHVPLRSLPLLLLALTWPGLVAAPPLAAQGVLVRTQVRATTHGELAAMRGDEPDPTATRTIAVEGGHLLVEGFPGGDLEDSGEWEHRTVVDLEAERAYVIEPADGEYESVPLETFVEELGMERPSGGGGIADLRIESGEEAGTRHGLRARNVLVSIAFEPEAAGTAHLVASLWLSRAPELRPLLDFPGRVGEGFEALGLTSGLDALRLVLNDEAVNAVADLASDRRTELEGFPVEVAVHLVWVETGETLDRAAVFRFPETGQVAGQEVLIRAVSELSELRTGELPDSLFEPPAGVVAGNAPAASEVLAGKIEELGVAAALEWYRELAETRPFAHRHDPYALAGLADDLEGRPDARRAVAELAVEAYPYAPYVHLALGSAYLDAGLRDRAMEAYRRALEINPWDREAREALAAAGESAPPPSLDREVPPEVLDAYEGEYVGELRRLAPHPLTDDPRAVDTYRFEIERREGRLVFMEERNGGTFETVLIPISRTRFVDEGLLDPDFPVLSYLLDFGHGDEGEVEVLFGNRRVVARRVEG